MAAVAGTAATRPPSLLSRLGPGIERWILPVYTLGVTTYLILPVAMSTR